MALKNGVLIFAAHADDTEFLAGGTVARLAAEGHEIVEVITTDNSRGTFELTADEIIPQSEDEARKAAKILGKKDVVFLGYSDGMLSDTPLNVLREKFMRLIRKYRPRIVMTFDPWAPFEPHPDHRQVAFAAIEALSFAHMPLFHPEHKKDGLAPHLVSEQYLFAKDPKFANKVIDTTPYIEKKIEALCAHDSQMKLTIDDLKMALTAAGANQETLAMLNRDNYKPLLDIYVKAHDQEVGKKIGVQFAEEFRYELAGGPVAALARGG
jgi:LmbE family N-acetylglucosaminyl deacetylase